MFRLLGSTKSRKNTFRISSDLNLVNIHYITSSTKFKNFYIFCIFFNFTKKKLPVLEMFNIKFLAFQMKHCYIMLYTNCEKVTFFGLNYNIYSGHDIGKIGLFRIGKHNMHSTHRYIYI